MSEKADNFLQLLYAQHYETMVKAAYRMMGDIDCAQDLVQQVFLLALLQQNEIAVHPLPEGWLMLTLRNLVLNERRKIRNHPNVSLEMISDLAGNEQPVSLDHLLPTKLSSEDRKILIWRFEQQMDYKEMADRLGISESGCRSRVSRAVANCRKYMQR